MAAGFMYMQVKPIHMLSDLLIHSMRHTDESWCVQVILVMCRIQTCMFRKAKIQDHFEVVKLAVPFRMNY